MNLILIIELQFDLTSHTGQGIAKPKDDKIVLECLWLVENKKNDNRRVQIYNLIINPNLPPKE